MENYTPDYFLGPIPPFYWSAHWWFDHSPMVNNLFVKNEAPILVKILNDAFLDPKSTCKSFCSILQSKESSSRWQIANSIYIWPVTAEEFAIPAHWLFVLNKVQLVDIYDSLMPWIPVILIDGPEREHSPLDFRRRTTRGSLATTYQVGEFLELLRPLPFPETISGKQPMIV